MAKRTSSKRGQSGNPGGRARKNPELREVEELARQASPMAIQRLVYWIGVGQRESLGGGLYGHPGQGVGQAGSGH
jgi:hypothetical protein